ncbi:glucose 1-dehydrogenase [Wenzhouxiangella sp. XN79A]|uniref:SDR family NAD(P)-dependent oxidoreductase n=1 Tax=Wenzhouxiangella sp. XN79A TaxID=2724193 RepID=UPI00144ACDD9|nr:glucose 1-dehydrogenase [Wenzhouxiangella sp. XN79A]NKI34785.1 glucose 1-dehydrogenase [Wenzhouxiangella sp. XN79A]
MNRVQGKVAVVTGGGLGIGRASAIRLAEEGAAVAVLDIDDEAGREAVATIEAAGGRAGFWHVDTTDEDAVKSCFAEVAERFGGLHVLVNNAGIAGVNKPTDEVTREEWEHLFDVNVTGVFLCTKHAIPHMRRAGSGSIINLSSIYGLIGAADLPPYHASKGAVRLMSKNDALFYATENIRVNSVHPAYIWTPLVADLGKQHPDGVEAFRKLLDSKHPMQHVGEPDDIAWGVVYLASDESKFVTGSELVIDGGYTAQ